MWEETHFGAPSELDVPSHSRFEYYGHPKTNMIGDRGWTLKITKFESNG